MKNLKLLLIIFSMILFGKTEAAYQLYADMDGVKLPYGTKLEMYMVQNVTTSTMGQGDIFQAYLAKDIYINNKLVLPSGSIFRGRIADVKSSRMLSRPAVLYLSLDHLVTKKGTQLPLNAGIAAVENYVLKTDGAITLNGGYFTALRKDLQDSGEMVSNAVEWGRDTGDDLFEGARYIFIPIGAVGGTIGCVAKSAYSTVANIFRHGNEIIIKKGAIFSIILLHELVIPS